MAVYGINKEGSEALKQLSTDLNTFNNDIGESTHRMLNVVNGLGSKLGIYEKQILEVLQSVLRAIKDGSDSVQTLTKKLTAMADNIDSLIGEGLTM